MIRALVLVLLAAPAAFAQSFAPGAAVYPSPATRSFLDAPTAQCVIATPCQWGGCVVLQPCPPGTLVPPQVAAPIAPAPPPAEPKAVEATPQPATPREPIVIEIRPQACPVCAVPPKPAPKAATQPAPKKSCPC